jgi:class 3 adenylate cyclase/tetratricopeptide (TPR) repeat protein
VTSIEEWLERIGLAKYAAVFAEHEITPEVLPDLTEADIDRLALPIGPRRRLMSAIEALGAPTRAQGSIHSADAPVGEPGMSQGAERRQITVMFCDLVGSTALAERLDPEELREVMQAYRKTCDEVVTRYKGLVAQYRGDALMAYFGWPSAHEDDAERSVRSALEIVHAVKGVRADPRLAVHIGVATGPVVVGAVSRADDAEAKLAVGETPNLAARLQGLADPDGVVIAPSTRRLIGAAFQLSDMGSHALKGIAQPVRAWRVHAVHRTLGRFEAARDGVALTPLVGRQEEVALLLRCWGQSRNGEGQVVLIGGEPGIGKSRLTQVLRERIATEPFIALRYQCSPFHLNSALYPFTEQLEVAAGFAREDTPEQKLDKMEGWLAGGPERRAEAAALVAALLSLPTDRYPPLNLSPQKQKEKTLEVLVGQLEALSLRQPVLMVLEDAHWIDPTSQELLDALVPRLEAMSIMSVITYRPEYMPDWANQPHVTILDVGRLERHEGEDLVAAVAQGRVLPAEVFERIVAHIDGVPLFAEELTKSVLESGLLQKDGDQYRLHRPLPALAIPTSLRDSLVARLDRLASVKDVIQIGACIGREFSYGLLARISPLRAEQLTEALRKLTEAGLVYSRGAAPDANYTFKHALVQDVAYDGLLKSKRHELHARLAQVLEEDFADRAANEPELLAHHYTRAGNLGKAIAWWREAGKLAARRMALQEAVGHFQQALTLIEQLPHSSEERDELELSIRRPLNGAWIGWRGWPASEVRDNALAILRLPNNAPDTLLMGLYGVWISTLTQGRVAEALDWAERLLAGGYQAGDIDMQILGHTAAMISHSYLGQLLAARKHGNRSVAEYDLQHADRVMQLAGHDTRTVFLTWSAHWTWMLGYPDQAVRISDEKDAYARRLGHAFNLGYALTVGAYAFDYRCEPERLIERAREADLLAREQGLPALYETMVPQVEGLARLRSGQLSESIFLLRQGIENWHRLGGHSRVPYLKSALAEALALQGDLDAGLQLVGESLEQIERPGWQERFHLAEVLRLKGWMLMRRGRVEEAETSLRASIDWARQQQAKSWELRSSTTLAQLLLERGHRDAAREVLEPIYNWFTEGFDTHDLKAARTLVESLS